MRYLRSRYTFGFSAPITQKEFYAEGSGQIVSIVTMKSTLGKTGD